MPAAVFLSRRNAGSIATKSPSLIPTTPLSCLRRGSRRKGPAESAIARVECPLRDSRFQQPRAASPSLCEWPARPHRKTRQATWHVIASGTVTVRYDTFWDDPAPSTRSSTKTTPFLTWPCFSCRPRPPRRKEHHRSPGSSGKLERGLSRTSGCHVFGECPFIHAGSGQLRCVGGRSDRSV